MSNLRVVPAVLALMWLGACGPSAQLGPDGAVTTDMCTGDETRCVGSTYQACIGGFFTEQESCSGSLTCAPDLGCVECRPSNPKACDGDTVRACNADGTFGDPIEVCEFEQCSNGNCGDETCGATGSDLIYLVDDTNNFYSFDPRLLPNDPFRTIGVLNCAGGTALPGFDPLGGPATPFSMSVDRNATAWVLYSSGRIFNVSTADASCAGTSFQVGQSGFELFGMGFVSNTAGSNDETLFISGGAASSQSGGNLGSINTSNLTVTNIGALTNTAEYQPELTGTGAAELFGYYPGTNSFVGRLDKSSGQNAQTWPLPSLTGTVRAWAFAHWGGEYYIFITTTDALGINTTANVLKLNTDSGMVTTARANTGRIIVGAGVSTCAPIVVN
jgi:hypothetical protein